MIINYNNVTNRMREIIANHSIAKKGNYAIIGGIGNWLYEIYDVNTYERIESKAFVSYSIVSLIEYAFETVVTVRETIYHFAIHCAMFVRVISRESLHKTFSCYCVITYIYFHTGYLL